MQQQDINLVLTGSRNSQLVDPTATIYSPCLSYPADICEEGGSELLELKVLGGDAVIAKDVDSKRQLTEPLKSFIYAPEPERGREGGQRAELQTQL